MITIDRFEAARAILDVDGELVELPRAALPAGAKEGDVLLLSIGDKADALTAAEQRLERLKSRAVVKDEIDL
jgi:hypothetical protein